MPTPQARIGRLWAAHTKYQRALLAPITLVGYAYDWAMFTAWCDAIQRCPLPATTETVCLYLVDLLEQGKKISTANRRHCAIAHEHRIRGLPPPPAAEIYELLNAAQRLRAEKPRKMKPLMIAELRAITASLRREGTPAALRDRALLVFGFATALRRSNIAQMGIADVEFSSEGLVVMVQREKQDPEGRGRLIGVPAGKHHDTCPVRTLRDWLQIRGATPGPLFWRVRSGDRGRPLDGDSICRVVKKRVERIGLEPSDYGGHSLRAGFITEAGLAGVGEFVIAAHTGHRSMEVLRGYFRRQGLWKANACAALDL